MNDTVRERALSLFGFDISVCIMTQPQLYIYYLAENMPTALKTKR